MGHPLTECPYVSSYSSLLLFCVLGLAFGPLNNEQFLFCKWSIHALFAERHSCRRNYVQVRDSDREPNFILTIHFERSRVVQPEAHHHNHSCAGNDSFSLWFLSAISLFLYSFLILESAFSSPIVLPASSGKSIKRFWETLLTSSQLSGPACPFYRRGLWGGGWFDCVSSSLATILDTSCFDYLLFFFSRSYVGTREGDYFTSWLYLVWHGRCSIINGRASTIHFGGTIIWNGLELAGEI